MYDLQKAYGGNLVFVTGSEGFKGRRLVRRLRELGAQVVGFDNRYDERDVTQDVRSLSSVLRAMEAAPDFVFHLAAQAFVPVGFDFPHATWETNVGGTLNVLEAVRRLNPALPTVIVTTDKVYGDTGDTYASEESPLVGRCPYSASKVAAETAARNYVETYGLNVATARAGNVIGGGDEGPGRLVPNALRALRDSKPVPVFHADAVRPWQHVDDVVDGYLRLGVALQTGAGRGAWNFGPIVHHTVAEVVAALIEAWDAADLGAPGRSAFVKSELRESNALRISSLKSRRDLGWSPRHNLNTAVKEIVAWERSSRAAPSST